MRKTTDALTKIFRKLNFVSHFLNGFPEPDFNVKGFFDDKEFIEQIEHHDPCIFIAPDIEPDIIDLPMLFPA